MTTTDPFESIVAKAQSVEVKSPTTPKLTLADIPKSVVTVVERSVTTDKIVKLDFPSEEIKAQFATFARGYALIRKPRATVRFTKASTPTELNVRAVPYVEREKPTTAAAAA